MKFSMSECGGTSTTPPPPPVLNGQASPDNNGLSTISMLDQSNSVQQISSVSSVDNGNSGFCEIRLGAKRLKTSTSLNSINTIGTTANNISNNINNNR